MGAYSRLGAYKLFLPLGWALIRISMVLTLISVSVQVKDTTESLLCYFFAFSCKINILHLLKMVKI